MSQTPAQLDAVQARGNLIVVAGAGTGKTTTLVERVLALLAQGGSVERLLLVTFTDAAAAEMRHRLRLKLGAVAAAAAGDAAWHWHEQLALLDTARIGTLHSFCRQLIREHFHLLGIDPAAGVLDDQQTRPLIETALDECLAPHFAGGDETSRAVREAIRRYAGGDAERIRPLILKLHRHAQSLPSPAAWFAGQRAALEAAEPVQWREWLTTAAREWAAEWREEVARNAGAAENLVRCVRALDDMAAKPAAAFAEILAAHAAAWPDRQKTRLTAPLEKFFDEAEFFLSQWTTADAGDGLAADWQNVRAPLAALLALAQEFGARFAAAKREQGGMDFSDLEQFALRLLWDAQGEPTAVAQACRELFAEVFVDECQDINAAQDAIIRAVSRDAAPGNRFLVGDVKQSIYQFRLARPQLFRDYEEAWRAGGAGRRIALVDNFRSHPEVIAFVNEFFAPLMRESVGGVAYEALNAGRTDENAGPIPAPPAAARRVEFHLLPKRGAEAEADDAAEERAANPAADAGDPGDLLAVEREARLVALRLRELKESGATLWDKEAKTLRPVEWRDMAVLLRSPRSRVEAFAKEFHRCGVPLQAERGGFLASLEVSDLLNLVRLLDNPLQDIPLLAVLRSPLVGMSLDELAQVRITSGARRLWVALREFLLKNRDATAEPARRKVDEFLQHYAKWRELARQASLSHCLETALADKHYEALTQASGRGAERVANVRKFIALVRQYDPYQRQGLFRFLRFIAALEAAEQDLEPATATAQDAVRLMSIHRSKGLEFPVVAVACLGTRFNTGDQRADVLVDEGFGVCGKAVAAGGAKHPTLAHWLAARRQHRQLLGEEMRLLYVAMTRARDHLILTGTAQRQAADEWESDLGRELPSRAIFKAQSALDWLLLWLPRVTRVEELGADEATNDLLRWRICREEPALPAPVAKPAALDAVPAANAPELDAVRQRLAWRYPHALAMDEPAKTNVTALRRRAAEADEDAREWRFSKATATTREGLDAATVGTLHHEFLQRLTLGGAGDEADLRAQLAAQVAAGQFTEAEAAAVDVAALAEFWRSETGALIRANAGCVRRELPFTARFTPAELAQLTGLGAAPALAGEFVVVQGVADLVVLRPGDIWLLDFKTDAVRGAELEARVAKYRPQVALYAAALAGIYRRPVTRRWLHFLRARQTVEV